MTIAEQIYALVKSLPQEQASEVLTFAESIHAKQVDLTQHNEPVDLAEWSESVHSLSGAWENDFPTLEEIRAKSGQDILYESL
jgi:hypothetical protein